MPAAATVGIVGMRAIRRDVAKLAESTSGPMYDALKAAGRAAAEPVAAAVRSALPHQSGALARDVRVGATRTGATVRLGRARIAYAGPVDFGGYPGDREYLRSGRYLFPAAQGLADRSARAYSDALEALFARSDIWTNTSSNPEAVRDP